MSNRGIWFSDETRRAIKLRSVALLVGKPPLKKKTIKMMVTMYLSGGGEEQITGLPEWLETARYYVMRNGEQVSATDKEVDGVNIVMGDPNLFEKTPKEAPGSHLSHFVIKQMGDADDPDTVLTFEIRTDFSTDIWMWCGQMGGEDFDVTFAIKAPSEQTADLILKNKEEQDEDEEDDASKGEDYETQRREACEPKHDKDFAPETVHIATPAEAAKSRGGRKPRANQPPPITDVEVAKRNLSLM